MKKVFGFLVSVLLTAGVLAQVPQRMSYQAVIRNNNNQLVTKKSVGMKVSILQGSETGAPVYVEVHAPTTNANGLVTIEIGGGLAITGAFTAINWANGPYFVKTETDPAGGANYTIVGISQLLSMPYALYAKTAENGFTGNYIVPRIATKGQRLSVSFSGGDNLVFAQSSSTCPKVYADVILSFVQSTTTVIYPVGKYYIDSKRFDAVFDIPSNVPSGLYDIIIGPSTPCQFNINSSFKIN